MELSTDLDVLARAARIGDKIISAFAAILIMVMFAYGGYSLYDNYMINRSGFLSSDIQKFKPSPEEAYHYSLEELMAINEDTRGWITIDNTHIDYPVLQGEDDMEYVNKDVMGEFSLSGAIFISCLNSPDFSDTYNLLYGHHMDNGGMFGDIIEFVNEDYFDKRETGILYNMGDTFDIKIFAALQTDAYDRHVYYFDKNQSNSDIINYLKSNAQCYRDIGIEATDHIIAMSTCLDATTNGRVIVFGRLDKR